METRRTRGAPEKGAEGVGLELGGQKKSAREGGARVAISDKACRKNRGTQCHAELAESWLGQSVKENVSQTRKVLSSFPLPRQLATCGVFREPEGSKIELL